MQSIWHPVDDGQSTEGRVKRNNQGRNGNKKISISSHIRIRPKIVHVLYGHGSGSPMRISLLSSDDFFLPISHPHLLQCCTFTSPPLRIQIMKQTTMAWEEKKVAKTRLLPLLVGIDGDTGVGSMRFCVFGPEQFGQPPRETWD